MQGYEVVTTDGAKFGRVADVVGDVLVVEHGTLLKHRNSLPREFAHVDDDDGVVRATVSKDVLKDAPSPSDGVDEEAVLTYYGLADPGTVSFDPDSPGREGWGSSTADDPNTGAEQDAYRQHVETDEEERLAVRAARPGQAPTGEEHTRRHRTRPGI